MVMVTCWLEDGPVLVVEPQAASSMALSSPSGSRKVQKCFSDINQVPPWSLKYQEYSGYPITRCVRSQNIGYVDTLLSANYGAERVRSLPAYDRVSCNVGRTHVAHSSCVYV